MVSFILIYDVNGEIKGLNEFEGEYLLVVLVFYLFCVMVGMGMLMLFVVWCGVYWLFCKDILFDWFIRVFIGMSFSGWVVMLVGWYVMEVGRQFYLVSGVLIIQDVVIGLLLVNIVMLFLLYVVLYVVLLIVYICMFMLMCCKLVGIEEIFVEECVQVK